MLGSNLYFQQQYMTALVTLPLWQHLVISLSSLVNFIINLISFIMFSNQHMISFIFVYLFIFLYPFASLLVSDLFIISFSFSAFNWGFFLSI